MFPVLKLTAFAKKIFGVFVKVDYYLNNANNLSDIGIYHA